MLTPPIRPPRKLKLITIVWLACCGAVGILFAHECGTSVATYDDY